MAFSLQKKNKNKNFLEKKQKNQITMKLKR